MVIFFLFVCFLNVPRRVPNTHKAISFCTLGYKCLRIYYFSLGTMSLNAPTVLSGVWWHGVAPLPITTSHKLISKHHTEVTFHSILSNQLRWTKYKFENDHKKFWVVFTLPRISSTIEFGGINDYLKYLCQFDPQWVVHRADPASSLNGYDCKEMRLLGGFVEILSHYYMASVSFHSCFL